MPDNDLISRTALLDAYDAAHNGPPGGARKLIEEAPAVCKPRLMEYNELGDTINKRAVWLECYKAESVSLAIICDRSEYNGSWMIFDYNSGKKHVMLRASYGQSWRCWTEKPTAEEREAAEWIHEGR